MLFLVVIFLIFTFAALSVLILSVNFYRETVKGAEQNENARDAAAYIREIVHQNDTSGGITLADFDGEPALRMADGSGYVLYIYMNGGSLTELYAKEGANVSAGDGQKIMELESFDIEETGDGVFTVTFVDASGQSGSVVAAPKSSDGGAIYEEKK
jgi:hypothetical protein